MNADDIREALDNAEDIWAQFAENVTTPVEKTAFERAEWDAKLARYPMLARSLADSRDRVAWAKARSNCIGASDAAKFANLQSALDGTYLRQKLYNPFGGNSYTQHGNDREASILRQFHLEQNFTLYHSAGNTRHVATPDAIKLGLGDSFFLSQVKTTLQKTKRLKTGELVVVHPFTTAKGEFSIPPGYKRQMWWEQYVMGAERTLFVWEEHIDGTPVDMEPSSAWFHRDDAEIEKLIVISDIVLAGMDEAAKFAREMEDQ